MERCQVNWTDHSAISRRTRSGPLLAAKLEDNHLRERALVYDIEQDDELVVHSARRGARAGVSPCSPTPPRLGVGGLRFNSREVAVEMDVGARVLGPGTTSFELALGTNVNPSEARGFAPGVRALFSCASPRSNPVPTFRPRASERRHRRGWFRRR